MKKKGCLIPVLIVVVALAVGIGVGVSQMTNNPGSTNKETDKTTQPKKRNSQKRGEFFGNMDGKYPSMP